jgi:hypothetical protein
MGLIAGECDISLPDISFEEIKDFVESTKFLHENSKSYKEEKTYYQHHGKMLPWNRRILEVDGNPYHNYRIRNPFVKLTPIIDSLPIVKSSRVILLISQEEQFDYDLNFHFDLDNGYGFRICYGLDTDKPFIEMSKLKSEYLENNNARSNINQNMLEDKIYKVIPTKSNTVFCLNGYNYPHRVPVTNSGSRFVLIIRGDMMPENNIKFLTRIDE